MRFWRVIASSDSSMSLFQSFFGFRRLSPGLVGVGVGGGPLFDTHLGGVVGSRGDEARDELTARS